MRPGDNEWHTNRHIQHRVCFFLGRRSTVVRHEKIKNIAKDICGGKVTMMANDPANRNDRSGEVVALPEPRCRKTGHDMNRQYVNLTVLAVMTLAATASPVSAQLRYGQWQVKPNTCEAQRLDGPFGNGPISPRVPETKEFQTCNYCRAVEDCPRLRDKLRHPIQCTKKQQCRRSSAGPPKD